MSLRLSTLVVAGAVLTGSAQAQFEAPLTHSVRVAPLPVNGLSSGAGSIEMFEMLRSLAQTARMPIGVQLARPGDSLSVPGSGLREVSSRGDALAWMTGEGYEGRIVDSILVIRPKAAWDDPQDVLNEPVPPLRLDRETLPDVMQDVTGRLYGRGGSPPAATGRLTGAFSGGCILDLMAFATRLDGRSIWVVTYGPSWGDDTARFGLAVMDFDHHSTAWGFVQPPPRRAGLR